MNDPVLDSGSDRSRGLQPAAPVPKWVSGASMMFMNN